MLPENQIHCNVMAVDFGLNIVVVYLGDGG